MTSPQELNSPDINGRTTPDAADRHRPRDPARPTAESPDSVPESLPESVEKVGQTGPDASDPPRAGHSGPNDNTNGLPNSDTQLDDARAAGRSTGTPD